MTSGLCGLPPFALIVVAAALARIPLAIFLPAAIVGRVSRFCLIAASPSLVQAWWL